MFDVGPGNGPRCCYDSGWLWKAPMLRETLKPNEWMMVEVYDGQGQFIGRMGIKAKAARGQSVSVLLDGKAEMFRRTKLVPLRGVEQTIGAYEDRTGAALPERRARLGVGHSERRIT